MNTTVDGAAFEAALVCLYPRLLKCAERLSGNRADAQDLVQEALERGLRRRNLFRTGGSPERWMVTILRRLFFDRCRSCRRLADTHAASAVAIPGALDTPVPPLPSDRYDAADLRRAVELLEDPFREVYTMFAFDNLSQSEIGQRLAMPASTVGTRLMRARARLRALLESDEARGVARRKRVTRKLVELAAPLELGDPSPNPLPSEGERAPLITM